MIFIRVKLRETCVFLTRENDDFTRENDEFTREKGNFTKENCDFSHDLPSSKLT